MSNANLQEVRAILSALREQISNQWDKVGAVANLLDAIETDFAASRNTPQLAVAEQIVNMLNGEHKLRTFEALTDATGYSRTQIEDALDEADIPYVVKKRRHDGAALIGLGCRNQL